MTDQTNVAGSRGDNMANVDASEDPQARVRYLDIATSQFSEYKRESYIALGLEPGMAVLDAGCGAGDDALAMAGIVGPTGKVVGLDLSATMVEQARMRAIASGLPAEFVQGSLYALPFPDDTFDASRSDRVFQHLDEPLRALLEVVRVTKPGGRINVIDPDWGTEMVDTDQRELARRARDSWWRRREGPGDIWRGRQLWGLFNQAGLIDLKVEGGLWSVTDLDVANQIARVLDWVRDAYEAGDATLEEAEAWERELHDRAATGRFFAAAGGIGVVGTVPDATKRE